MTLKSPHSFRSVFVVGLLLIPNWADDTTSWTMAADDAHTVTFLRWGQVRPPFQVGCPGSTPDGSVETAATFGDLGMRGQAVVVW